jgi:hypothetical protein
MEKPMDFPNADWDPRVRVVLRYPTQAPAWEPNWIPFDQAQSPDPDLGPWLVYRKPSFRALPVRDLDPIASALATLGTNPTRREIKAFAARFGPLAHPTPLIRYEARGGAKVVRVGGDDAMGETLGTWIDGATRYAELSALWRAVVAFEADPVDVGNADVIRARVRRDRTGLHVLFGTRQDLVLSAADFPAAFRHTPVTDLAGNARLILATYVNAVLGEHVTVRVVQRQMRLTPDCLTGAVYLRLAGQLCAVSGEGRLRHCAWCGVVFEGRPNQRYCSTSCKDKAAYARGKAAFERGPDEAPGAA